MDIRTHRCVLCNATDNAEVADYFTGQYKNIPFYPDPTNQNSDICAECFDHIDRYADDDNEDFDFEVELDMD